MQARLVVDTAELTDAIPSSNVILYGCMILIYIALYVGWTKNVIQNKEICIYKGSVLSYQKWPRSFVHIIVGLLFVNMLHY